MNKTIGWVVGIIVLLIVVWFAFTMINVDVTEEGALPEVSVEGGQLPKADVTTGDIDVGTEEKTIEVPTIDVQPAPESDKPAN
ncbi:hypothetical protein VSX64_00360 [Aurantimonas sp. C2-6-R+9]|uniref:hypothetical protein n=1 Tax=unclassified Aurantimonas TaxID=2638230 RepID=UPI002E17A1D7|nr:MULTISPECIES: hypothetical protein [unclassified Aurantimonas]MEC5289079.1 hypothetical protein [Aurantimonas sp. C2-3-R2]MEC5379346.1 hypothetical protein [Aurantimonas sp. C2-6-R+9]MEC5410099.1 hypothetical protein [Aurantimonas sp. C2-4-R8]